MSDSSTRDDAPVEGDAPVDLRRAGVAVRRHGRSVAAFAGLVTVLVLVVSLASPDRYRATARIVADPAPGQSVDVEAVDRRLATYAELVTAPSVLADAARRLPWESPASLDGSVSASFDPAVSVLDVVATGTDPERVPQIANTVAETFVAERDRLEARAAIQARERLAEEIERLRTVGTQSTTLDAMRERLSELAVTAATAGSGLRLVEPATKPTAAFAPRPFRSALLALLSALLLAVLVVIARDLARPAPADVAALSRITGLPLLAALPADGAGLWERADAALGGLWQRSRAIDHAAVEEAALQSAVRSALPPRGQRIVLVHGIDESDGAAQVAAALGRALNWGGHETVLVRFARPSGSRRAPAGVPTTYCTDLDEQLDELKGTQYRYVIVEATRVARGARLRPLAARSVAVILVARLDLATSADAAAGRRLVDALRLRGLGLVAICAPADVAEVVRTTPTAPLRPAARSRGSQNGAHAPMPTGADAG
jgi:capsular polysaccharide biosynthesis protein